MAHLNRAAQARRSMRRFRSREESPMTAGLSFPKDKIKILLLEGVHQSAVDLLHAAGYDNVTLLPKALDGAELREAMQGVHIVGIRSRTRLTEEIFEAADRLIAVGCFCIGTNQVTLPSARVRGVPVFNAPFSNTRSVAELTIGEIVMLMRRIFPRSVSAHEGGWDKSATDSTEVRGKTLGIVGYGNIGGQLSHLAEAMGMRVVYYDLIDKLSLGNAESCKTLDDLLGQSDVVSMHVPETAQTKNMMGEAQFRAMKPGAYFINNARGTVVDIDALARALKDKHLRGAAVDVFPKEPAGNKEKFVSPLQGLENVILSPHIGGSTEEAQERIGAEVARKLIDYSDIGSTLGAVNFPQVQLPPRPNGTRYMHVHRNVPGMMGKLNDIFSKYSMNIASQFLQTDGDVGYVVIEADGTREDCLQVLEEIRELEGTIRARIIYER
jgi:D-3-phosphoglycerate dehydrogenase